MIRNPVVSGQFYEDDPDELTRFIQNCFDHKYGPGKKLPNLKDIVNTFKGIDYIVDTNPNKFIPT